MGPGKHTNAHSAHMGEHTCMGPQMGRGHESWHTCVWDACAWDPQMGRGHASRNNHGDSCISACVCCTLENKLEASGKGDFTLSR